MYRTVSNDFAPEEKFDYDMLVFLQPFRNQFITEKLPELSSSKISKSDASDRQQQKL